MSELAYIHPDDEQQTLDIQLPKRQSSFKVTSARRPTPVELHPRQRVKIVATGYVDAVSLDFKGDENSGTWTVVLDEIHLESE